MVQKPNSLVAWLLGCSLPDLLLQKFITGFNPLLRNPRSSPDIFKLCTFLFHCQVTLLKCTMLMKWSKLNHYIHIVHT